MADIVKFVNRGIAPTMRTVNFTQADAGDGDTLMIRDSLGHDAHTLVIEAAATMLIRFNTRYKVYPHRGSPEMFDMNQINVPDLAREENLIDLTSPAAVTLEANETFTLKDDIPIRDIYIATVSGNFDIFAA